jgi:hypothetical protein
MNIRINNIEFKKYISTKRDKSLYEIVKWYPNIHFGKEEEYKKDGYVDSFGGEFLRKDGHEIHKSFFISPESCYVIAFIEKGKESWELRSVGERLLGLTPEEQQHFFTAYTLGQNKLNKNEIRIL